jgi:hypothetical protein
VVSKAAPTSAQESDTLSKKNRLIANRLHAFILSKHKHRKRAHRRLVATYAHRLAERIVLEAKRNRISVVAFATIAWIESWFWPGVEGTSDETGVWQIWPHSKAVRQEWDALRKQKRIGIFPDLPWRRLGRKMQRRVLGTVDVSTALAARIVRRLLRWCRAKHKVYSDPLLGSRRHKYEIDRYGHYNSGRRWPKPVYYFQLRRRSRTLRKVLHAR